ncbi:MAG: multiple antibiotic resistance protein [Frankiales bacterium]|jgi:multiple antibiotic resistance protein|nr:multiple antibiotic resistance protein [Frankiales bacterium]MDX6274104.1 multiple antibiotic resistance protein [Frankiales bacterium]
MSQLIDPRLFGEVFVTLTVIMDPLGTVPLFLGLTRGRSSKERARLAWQAVAVAGFVIGLFALFGQAILDYLGITVPALQGAGGLLLSIVALELLTDRQDEPTERPDVNIALVPLGTPLLAGPGAIVATIVFVRRIDNGADAVALVAGVLAVLVVLWLSLRFSAGVIRLIRESGVQLVTRIFGLLLSAIAVQLIAEAVRGFIRQGL